MCRQLLQTFRTRRSSVKSTKSRLRLGTIIGILTILLPAIFVSTFVHVAVARAAGASYTRLISSAGTSSFASASNGTSDPAWPEFAGATDSNPGPAPYNGAIFNRSQSQSNSQGASANSGKKAKSNPELIKSFDGLNHRQQRLANGGNQFSVEPPDQGLCVGNGFILETVNDVMNVYDSSGTSLKGVTDLNSFYGYPPAIIRSPRFDGPFVTDPSCYFDKATQ